MNNGSDLAQLMWSVQALAQGAARQRLLYPEFVSVPDELALEFEEHYSAFLGCKDGLADQAQIRALERLDRMLESMSGPSNLEYWENTALDSNPAWNEVRILAKQVLKAMGWDDTPPPSSRDIFVGPW